MDYTDHQAQTPNGKFEISVMCIHSCPRHESGSISSQVICALAGRSEYQTKEAQCTTAESRLSMCGPDDVSFVPISECSVPCCTDVLQVFWDGVESVGYGSIVPLRRAELRIGPLDSP
jgi:hypothetical protein